MPSPDPRSPSLAAGQGLHLGGTLGLALAATSIWIVLGGPAQPVFWAALAVPIVHQLFVLVCWRMELRAGLTSRTIGFRGYLLGFLLLFSARFVTLIAVAWLDQGSLGLPLAARVPLVVLLAAPAFYAIQSVHRYFGFQRAAGADHFDRKYRALPFVREGIFRYTRNGMYAYAFLIFWAIAVAFDSAAALVIAAYAHGSIWLHYLGTEQPDMAYIYGAARTRGQSRGQSRG
ncbi:MAG: hypothetical protein H6711_10130 [Myxococcales bacterium]|nr:hypothetical protein [Myxococcales bacterium]